MIFQKRSYSGQLGAPSYIITVAPFCRRAVDNIAVAGHQPMSAVHQYTSSSCRSKMYFEVR